ncbi:MAG: DUF1566 domain-containing protein [Methylomonas sp.]|jgi:hypothetical protein
MQNGNTLLAAGLLFSLITIDAQATVDAQTQQNLMLVNGGLTVYDMGSNTLWTSNANLLGAMESTNSSLVQTIIADDPVIHDTPNIFDNGGSGLYNLSAKDFGANGQVDWWAAQAFVHYLNVIDYAGITTWQLPSTLNSGASVGYDLTNSQLGELFNGELGGSVYGNSAYFSNIQSSAYWSGSEAALQYGYAWYLNTRTDSQNYNDFKYLNNYAWPVSTIIMPCSSDPSLCACCAPPPNLIVSSSVPLPGTAWIMLTGLALLNLRRPVSTVKWPI